EVLVGRALGAHLRVADDRADLVPRALAEPLGAGPALLAAVHEGLLVLGEAPALRRRARGRRFAGALGRGASSFSRLRGLGGRAGAACGDEDERGGAGEEVAHEGSGYSRRRGPWYTRRPMPTENPLLAIRTPVPF